MLFSDYSLDQGEDINVHVYIPEKLADMELA